MLWLPQDVDSPFAILAKDNDIMWGGGRPDDITIIVSRVVESTEVAPLGERPPPAYSGPGAPPEAIMVAEREAAVAAEREAALIEELEDRDVSW